MQSTARTVHPRIGIKYKNTHAQWNFPKLRTNPVLAKGIQASQEFLCLSFFPIVAQASEVYIQIATAIKIKRTIAPAINAPRALLAIAFCSVSVKTIFHFLLNNKINKFIYYLVILVFFYIVAFLFLKEK